MFRWAWKSLLTQKTGVFGSAAGVASAFILVIFFDAVFRGESTQIITYIEHTRPNIWVMQRGVSNMHMASSFLWDWKADKIATLPGVKQVTPILYLNSVVNIGDQKALSYVVGLEPGSARAGPWEMEAGRSLPKPGEAIIPAVMATLADIGIGDTVSITDKSFKVVGLSKDTYSMANSITFVTFKDLEDILSSTGTYSYLLVDTDEGVDANELSTRIMNDVEKINAMPHEEFIKSDYRMSMQMGLEIIFLMTVICSALATLIVGFTAYSQVMNKRRELAIAKALGMRNMSIVNSVIFQSVAITSLGFLMAVIFALTIIPRISTLVPQVSLLVSPSAFIQIGLVALVVAIVGSLIPAYYVSRLDPTSAFHV